VAVVRKTPVFCIFQRGGKVENLRVLFILMPGAVTVVWLTWDIKSIIVFTMGMIRLPMVSDILTALSPSGFIQNED